MAGRPNRQLRAGCEHRVAVRCDLFEFVALRGVRYLYVEQVALDVLADLTAPSTPQHFMDELQGLADAIGVDRQVLWRIHLIGELTQVGLLYPCLPVIASTFVGFFRAIAPCMVRGAMLPRAARRSRSAALTGTPTSLLSSLQP